MHRVMRSWLPVALWLAATAAWAAEMSVQVQSAQVRADASFLGRMVGSLPYGTRVNVVQERGDWRMVQQAGGVSGWLHHSALTKKKIVMKAGAQDVATTASGDELALAGKGFNSDVEADFKSKNKDIDFTWIDRMEKYRVTSEEIARFLAAGQVKPPQG